MHQAKKEEGNQRAAAELDFPDSASDDRISVDQENVWDTDINIADDEFLVLGDGGKGEAQENNPPDGTSSGDTLREETSRVEHSEDVKDGHIVGDGECQIKEPPGGDNQTGGSKHGGVLNCIKETHNRENNQKEQTHNTGEQVNDKGSTNVNLHGDEQFRGNSGKETIEEESISPLYHGADITEEGCPPDGTNDKCPNYAVQTRMVKMDLFFNQKDENRLNSAGDENVRGKLQKGISRSDLLPNETIPVIVAMEKSEECRQPCELQSDVATMDGGQIQGEVVTITQLKKQCEILQKKLQQYERRNEEQTSAKNELLEKVKTYERNCNKVNEENMEGEERYEQIKTYCSQISSKCDEYEKKLQEMHREMEKNKNVIKRKEEEMKENMTKAEADLARKDRTIEEMKNIIEQYKREINESEHNLTQKEEEKRNDQLMYQEEIHTLEQKITHLENQLSNKQEENTQLRNKNKELNDEYTYLKMKEEKNEENICNLKSNLQMNEQERSVKYEMIQEQNNKIEQLLMENKKNSKDIELLRNEKSKVENENELLKKDLLYVQEKLKSIEKHSYDIYEMKDYVETVIEKNRNLMEQLESEKNQKEELKGKIKFFLTEMNNSAICLKSYKMKCSFFVDVLRKCEAKMGLLRKKLKGYESVESFHGRWMVHPALGVALMEVATDPTDKVDDHPPDKLGGNLRDNRPDNPHDYDKNLIRQTILLREELQTEIRKAEHVAEKMLKLQNTVKEKNLLINEKNYKLNKYKLLNKNLMNAIAGYQSNMKVMKENIHKLEKQIELKEIKSIMVPPKVTVHVSKLASFENNLKNELKGLIGNSSTFLETTFKYINENPIKKNLQNKAFFSSAVEKKRDEGEKKVGGGTVKEAAPPSSVSNAEGAIPNSPNTSIATTSPGDGSLADVTGFARNFIYTNMNRIPNFISDQNGKSSSAQMGAAKTMELAHPSRDTVVWKNDGDTIKGNNAARKDAEGNQAEARLMEDNLIEPNQVQLPKPDAEAHRNNKYIDLFMGKKNLNKVSNTSDILKGQHVSQFYANTENKIKDLFDMNKKKESPKIKEKEESQKSFHSSENAFFPMHIFGGSKVKEALPNPPGDAKNEGELGFTPTSGENANKYDLAGCKKKSLNSLYYDRKSEAEGNTPEETKQMDKRQEKLLPSSSDEDAQINDDVWNEKIDLDNFEVEEL
ncbi:hypothetical protein C922_00113 [Plasmodium inui San Antonio 1]|uniref:Rhoptry protein n=1 Tax=Plasmodium inui San Antonio 1 TaxID=1237626 RepID=W7AC29_9APIC|nr:hypothetical protein C922_00113 [Plasmodium inui San Antonio 1]EUD69250.1 hypothetical protein C922_00113 [Plasmodium inui San Antonio 1]